MGTLRYASIFRRAAALILDLPFIIILYYFCDSFCAFLHDAWGTMFDTFFIMYIVVIIFYFCSFECSPLQGSIGKILVGIRVYKRSSDDNISFSRAFVRFCFKLFSLIIFPLSILLIIITKKHQCLHDLIASTVVIREE
jgi:uncharacterized RDD family membrane protein YckC